MESLALLNGDMGRGFKILSFGSGFELGPSNLLIEKL